MRWGAARRLHILMMGVTLLGLGASGVAQQSSGTKPAGPQPAGPAQTTPQQGGDEPSGNGEQAAAPTLRVNVRLVNVYVNATDPRGAPVAGLVRENFRLTEDGLPQRIAVFEKQSDKPLSIVLAVDTSGSVRKDWEPEMSAAVHFLKTLVRPVDKVELLEFSTHVRQMVPFTNNVKKIDGGLKDMRPGFATALYDVVIQAASDLKTQTGRKIIVIVSDGGNTVHGPTYEQAFRAAVEAEASIYSLIDVPVEASAGRELGGEHAMITLSEDTGGKFYYAGDPVKLEAAFQQLSDDLRTQYLLAYYPKSLVGPDFRRIAVTLRAATGAGGGPTAAGPAESDSKEPRVPTVMPGVVLRYRPGYYPAQPDAGRQ
jgi:Ca-activated chloride channel family protein